MVKEECKYFDECSAPLCPIDEDSLQYGAWFPTEDTCRLQPLPEWVKRQRKIAKKIGFEAGCFTVRMLQRKCNITVALKGIDPDRGPVKNYEGKWLEKHPEYNVTPQAKALGKPPFSGAKSA